MGDKYPNFETLAKYSSLGKDYRIVVNQRGPDNVAIIAPHGGSIERRTSEITRAIAAGRHRYYLFEGLDPDGSFDQLHITSHRFDEPACLNLVASVETVVAIHGCSGKETQIFLGGLHEELKARIGHFLTLENIPVALEEHKYQGRHRNNICNRGRLGAGVQIEFSDGLRGGKDELRAIQAIRKALF